MTGFNSDGCRAAILNLGVSVKHVKLKQRNVDRVALQINVSVLHNSVTHQNIFQGTVPHILQTQNITGAHITGRCIQILNKRSLVKDLC